MSRTASGPSGGLALYPTQAPDSLGDIAQLAEDLGYEHVWFGDSQNIWREMYTCMAAVAARTSRITLGSGVTNGVTRHRSVIASAWATLHELSGGRVAAGFGVGDSALRTIGQRPMAVAELDNLVADLRALWNTHKVTKRPEGATYRLAYLDHTLHVPVYLAASGPRLLGLAGRIADGVILLVGTDAETVRTALATVATGAESAGRSIDDIHVVLWTPVAIDPDAAVARNRVRPHVARTLLRPIGAELTSQEQQAVTRIRDQYDYYAHMVQGAAHTRLVPDQLVERFALAGAHDSCRDQIATLGSLGVDQIAMVPFPGTEQRLDDAIRDFAALWPPAPTPNTP